jgi:hypothetical protein
MSIAIRSVKSVAVWCVFTLPCAAALAQTPPQIHQTSDFL